ncbi:MAG: hypothetical protein IPK61_00645 [Saprospiraceae bacterium]|nr:hypothetical protein [Saprospiraceae bacterium]
MSPLDASAIPKLVLVAPLDKPRFFVQIRSPVQLNRERIPVDWLAASDPKPIVTIEPSFIVSMA